MKIPFISKHHKGTIDIKETPEPKKIDINKLSGVERRNYRNAQYIDRLRRSR